MNVLKILSVLLIMLSAVIVPVSADHESVTTYYVEYTDVDTQKKEEIAKDFFWFKHAASDPENFYWDKHRFRFDAGPGAHIVHSNEKEYFDEKQTPEAYFDNYYITAEPTIGSSKDKSLTIHFKNEVIGFEIVMHDNTGATIDVYDVNGKMIKSMYQNHFHAGYNPWDEKGNPSPYINLGKAVITYDTDKPEKISSIIIKRHSYDNKPRFTCTDSDGGKDKFTKGILNIYTPSGDLDDIHEDTCVDVFSYEDWNNKEVLQSNKLEELWCYSSQPTVINVECEFGCYDGACRKSADEVPKTVTPVVPETPKVTPSIPTEKIYLTGSNDEPGFANMDWNDISGLGTKFDKYNVKWDKGYYLNSDHADSWISFGSYYNLGNLEEGPWTFQVCLSDNKKVFENTCSNVVTVDVTSFPVEYIEENIITTEVATQYTAPVIDSVVNIPITTAVSDDSNYVVWTRSSDKTHTGVVAKYVLENGEWVLKERTGSQLRDTTTVTPTNSYPDRAYRADVKLNEGEVATFVAFYGDSIIPSTIDVEQLEKAKGYVMKFEGTKKSDGKVHACSYEKGCKDDYSSHAEEMVFYENGMFLTIYDKDNDYITTAVVTEVEIFDEDNPYTEYAYPETEYACASGCFYNDKCLPIGTRLRNGETKYCSWDGTMTPQEEIGTSCQNNYECSTNSCMSGVCTDLEQQLQEQQNLLERILDWINRYF